MRGLVVAIVLAAAAEPAAARPVRGLVFADTDGDGRPGTGERGVPGVVVARGIHAYATTDAAGAFTLEVPEGATGAGALVWARVPDGFAPGPVWAPLDGKAEVELALRPTAPHAGPLTFVVAADTHLSIAQPFFGDLAAAASAAVAVDPTGAGPAFFTILGDLTQDSGDAQLALVDAQLAGLGVPYVPVPGNHDWYDDGESWFRRYGPDNYSFDVGRTHFVVWNMMMPALDIEHYLGAELARVAPDMTVVALTHAPPVPEILDVLHRLGVDYVLTGHTHTSRAVDHGDLVELTTQPLLMGGIDFTPAGYRVVTLDGGRLASYHRTTTAPHATVISPAVGRCAPGTGAEVIVAAELDAATAAVTARVDCGTPIALRYAGGWSWRATLPPLAAGPHALAVEARSPSGARASASAAFEVCAPTRHEPGPAAWPQLGGAPGHAGATPREIAPPLAARWTAVAGGHVLQAAPAVGDDAVFAAVTDLGTGGSGGVIALELATGAVRWRVATAAPVRGGPVLAAGTVIVGELDGTTVGLDARTGAERWRYELGGGLPAEAASVFAPAAVDGDDVLLGNQRHFAVLEARSGRPLWTADPVPGGAYSQSLAAVAIGDGVVVGVFHRELGGVVAWDRVTGRELWRLEGEQAVAINATPVIADGAVYVVNGLTEVIALDLATGAERWQVKLDPAGFDWGLATAGAPAIAGGVLVVPTLYGDLVALEAVTGAELWRLAARPGPLRTTHYRGAREAGWEAAPVITGDLVWAADTSGRLVAVELRTGSVLWHTELGAPVLAGLAVAGRWLVVASYDGTVRALGPPDRPPTVGLLAPGDAACAVPAARTGCCDASAGPPWPAALVVLGYARRRRRRRTSPSSATPSGQPAPPPALHA